MSEITMAGDRPDSLSLRTVAAGEAAMAGRSRGLRALLPFAGPAVIASIAYMDPGNFATNIQAGSKYGYALLWVVVLANVIAMLFQALSAKLGIVTGKSLAAHCRDRFPAPLVWAMWGVSEVAAMATDLAEFLGGGIGLSLLFGLPLLVSLGITAVVTYTVMVLGGRGFRRMELVIGGFVAVIGLSYLIELFIAPPAWGAFARGALIPTLPDGDAVGLAVAMIGATVMPHAIYLHSALVTGRMPAATDAQRARVLRFSNREVLIALGFAGLVNLAMIAMAAAVFHGGHDDIAEIETAYTTLGPLLGSGAAAVFMISLLASGFSSSVVGTMAGQAIMQDFMHFRIPVWLRRAVTMLPAFAVVAMGVNATDSLVASQMVLSVALPVPMIALLILTGLPSVMGPFANSRPLQALAIVATVVVLGLNALLLLQAMGIDPIGP
jgi:manganese transport protein